MACRGSSLATQSSSVWRAPCKKRALLVHVSGNTVIIHATQKTPSQVRVSVKRRCRKQGDRTARRLLARAHRTCATAAPRRRPAPRRPRTARMRAPRRPLPAPARLCKHHSASLAREKPACHEEGCIVCCWSRKPFTHWTQLGHARQAISAKATFDQARACSTTVMAVRGCSAPMSTPSTACRTVASASRSAGPGAPARGEPVQQHSPSVSKTRWPPQRPALPE